MKKRLYNYFVQIRRGREIINFLDALTGEWVNSAPEINHFQKFKSGDFDSLVEKLHLSNFLLWNTESLIRKNDYGGDCRGLKKKIDSLNLERNRTIEDIDSRIESLLNLPSVPLEELDKYYINSETPGQIIDRLSILSLKIFFRKKKEKPDRGEIGMLEYQRNFLVVAFDRFLDHLEKGNGFMISFRAFKQYEDSELIPVRESKEEI